MRTLNTEIIQGDVRDSLRAMPAESVNCCVTSPPYFGLRDYGMAAQIGLESTPDAYVAQMVEVFREVRRVLRNDGTLWLNLGDSYATGAGGVGDCPGGGKQGENWKLRGTTTPPNRMPLPGLKPKDLIGIPWRVAFALQADGWYLRQDIIWAKPNPMPHPVKDRCTSAHEYIFLMAKSRRYYYNADNIKEDRVTNEGRPDGAKRDRVFGYDSKQKKMGRNAAGFNGRWDAAEDKGMTGAKKNKRSVWFVAPKPYVGAHFATFPPDLIEPCIRAGCPLGGVVLDPFGGAGTTGMVANRLARRAILCELNPEYVTLAAARIAADPQAAAVTEVFA